MPAPYLAPEIIDNIIDNLSDERATLFDCSIVSKSWIPHARKHLFATIRFTSSADVQRWRLLFRNSQVPPGQFIKTLHLTSRSRENYGSGMADFVVIIQPLTEANTDLMDLIAALTMADTETGVAIQAFSKVLSLEVDTTYDPCKLAISFVSLHGFSAALTSFTIVTSHPTLEIFLNFALSFPRLENLTLCQNRHFEGHALVRRPDIHPPLTGILKLSSGVRGIIKAVIGPLLEQGVEFQFQKVSVCCKVKEQEVEALEAVIERCSNTLQYLKVQFFGWWDPSPRPFKLWLNLSKAKKLARLEFVSVGLNARWIVTTLESLRDDQQGIGISIDVKFDQIKYKTGDLDFLTGNVDPTVYEEWEVLDKLLVERWMTNSIPTTFTATCDSVRGNPNPEMKWMEKLLPKGVSQRAVHPYRREV